MSCRQPPFPFHNGDQARTTIGAQITRSRAPWTPSQPPRLARRTKASLCQGVLAVFFAALEVGFGRCGLTGGYGSLAFPAAEYGRRLAAPPGRSSSLGCGRSIWTCGFAGGLVAAIGERAALPGMLASAVGWWPGPGVACPKR